ncbi:hypothetical protein [Lentzea sp. NEAU-D7]|uniref:hypothetical protein n=1 Tax=Lentzea sp. NEAU-D7 TaxID=2994667 RepID=UPI00224B70FE|nr:hypothetical protein [Lentzea sp. NEAU-D7]MCX2949924.1 hypothetical protein [Lentzea sp. NEAU-D7]
MSTIMRFYRTYTPAQYERAVELWGNLLDSHVIRLSGDTWGRGIEKIEPDHLHQLIMSDGAETFDYEAVTVTLVSYSDHHGSEFDAANVLALEGTPGVETKTEGRGGEGYAQVQLGELPGDLGEDIDTCLEWLAHIVECVDRIADYPVLDHDKLYEYEQELREAAWDEWLRSDLIGELDKWAGGDGWEDFGVSDDELREMFYGYIPAYWEFQSATSITNTSFREITEHIQGTVLAAWRKWVYDPAQPALPLSV